jgi:hypothetical protein
MIVLHKLRQDKTFRFKFRLIPAFREKTAVVSEPGRRDEINAREGCG